MMFEDIFVADAWETCGNLAGRMFRSRRVAVCHGRRSRPPLLQRAAMRPDGSDDNSLRMKAQDLDNHVGKTLRLATTARCRRTIRSSAGPVRSPRSSPTASQRLRPGVSSRDGRVVAGRDRSARRRRGQHPCAGHNYGWPLVSMGRNYTGTLVSDQPWFARRAWKTRACSGCRRSALRACCSTPATSSRAGRAACSWARSHAAADSRRVQSAVAGRATRAVAHSSRCAHPRRAAGA